MKKDAIQETIKAAISRLEIKPLSDQDLGLDTLLEIAKRGEDIERLSQTAFLGPERVKARPAFFGKMDLGEFRAWIEGWLKTKVREIICNQLYPEIDTEEERKALIDKYDDKIVDAIVSAYPALAPGRRIIKYVVRYLMAQGLSRAAQNFGEYCQI